MKKKAYLLFFSIISFLVVGSVVYLQSGSFARVIKRIVERSLPDDLGVVGDFRDLSIHLFPPKLSINEPKVQVKQNNFLRLPEGSRVEAKRLELRFYPLQILSGNIRVHDAVIVEGDVNLKLDPKLLKPPAKKKRKEKIFDWDDLLKVQAEALTLRDTKVHIELMNPTLEANFVARKLRVSQETRADDQLAVRLELEVENISGNFPKGWKVPHRLDAVSTNALITESGVELEGITLRALGISAKLLGSLKGNLLEGEKLSVDGSLELGGSIPLILDLLDYPKEAKNLDGFVTYSGNIRGTLAKNEMLSGDGSLHINRFRFKSWNADDVQAMATWKLPVGNQAGELRLKSASIQAAEVPRSGGHQPGSGGKIELGEMVIPFGKGINPIKNLTAKVKMERAHIHWLAAEVIEDVYALDFRVSGEIEVKVPELKKKVGSQQDWELLIGTQLEILGFQLDNQRFKKSKTLKKLLSVESLKVSGNLKVNAAGVFPNPLHLTVGETSFEVGGSITGERGYDLRAQGKVDLADLGTLAETPIQGEGTLQVRVHGPAQRVFIDFDTDLKQARYLNLHLGDLKGRITWDDDPQRLVFNQVQLTQGRMNYVGNGVLDFGGRERADLYFDIKKGDIQDLIEVFRPLVSDLWWFPESLSGSMVGKINVTGGLDLDRLKVTGQISGQDWDFYSEKFKNVSLVGGFDSGRYFVSYARARKNLGFVEGAIGFDPEAGLSWQGRLEDFRFTDLDHVARLDVPIRGFMRLETQGQDSPQGLKSKTNWGLAQVSVRGQGLPDSDLELETKDQILTIKGRGNGEQGTLGLVYHLNPNRKSNARNQLKLQLKNLDFSPAILLLNPKLAQDSALGTRVSGKLDLTFDSGQIEFGSGRLELKDFGVSKTGHSIQLDKPVEAEVRNGSFTLPSVRFLGPASDVKINLESKSANLQGKVNGFLDLGVLEYVLSIVDRGRGKVVVDGDLSGPMRKPTLEGSAEIEDGSITSTALESPFTKLNAEVVLKNDKVSLRRLTADLAGGSVSGGGVVELFTDRVPSGKLDFQLANNRIKIYPFQYVHLGGKLSIHGNRLPYQVEGDLYGKSALSREDFYSGKGRGRQAVKYGPSKLGARGGQSLFDLNISLKANDRIYVRNNLFDVEMKGDVRLVNTLEDPRILGSADLIRGKINFKEHVFDIQSTRIEFDSPTVLNPKFNLIASTEVKGTRVKLFAGGRMDQWKLELTSDPVLPESEIIQLLALGVTSDEMRKYRSGDAYVLQQGEAASLLLDSFGFNRDVKDKTGFEIQLEEAKSQQMGTSIFRPQSTTDSSAAPKVVIKRKIGKKLNVSVGSTVGVGTATGQEGKIEVENVVPGVSVIGIWNKFEGTSVEDNQNSYGVDLKFEKRFR